MEQKIYWNTMKCLALIMYKFSHCHSPAQKQKFSCETQASHSHQQTSHCHALAEAGHHSSLGQVTCKLFQELVKALLPCIAVDFVRVGDADSFLGRHIFESFHPTFPVVACEKTQICKGIVALFRYNQNAKALEP